MRSCCAVGTGMPKMSFGKGGGGAGTWPSCLSTAAIVAAAVQRPPPPPLRAGTQSARALSWECRRSAACRTCQACPLACPATLKVTCNSRLLDPQWLGCRGPVCNACEGHSQAHPQAHPGAAQPAELA